LIHYVYDEVYLLEWDNIQIDDIIVRIVSNPYVHPITFEVQSNCVKMGIVTEKHKAETALLRSVLGNVAQHVPGYVQITWIASKFGLECDKGVYHCWK
jgi:hypothetical protein